MKALLLKLNERHLAVQLLVMCIAVFAYPALASSPPKIVLDCNALMTPDTKAGHSNIEEFAKRLELVPESEVQQRMGNLSITIFAGLSRDKDGKLKPLFNGRPFQSIRQNLPSSPFGGSGWDPFRQNRIINLDVASHSNMNPTFNSMADILPAALKSFLKERTFVTAPYLQQTQYQVLMATAPKNNGKLGGRTGILLNNGLPIIIRDKMSGKEFTIEVKGIGSAKGGYEKDEIKNEGGFQSGGEWSIIGGVIGKQGVREDQNTNRFAFNVIKQPENAVLSLGYQTFDTNLGPQAINFRLTPGSIRMNYLYKPDPMEPVEPYSDADVSRMSNRMAYLLLKSILSGMIPMTHPENFIGSRLGPEVYMTDFSDNLHISRFPVNWGFNYRDLQNTVGSSLDSIEQFPGFNDSKNLSDVVAGYLDALEGTKFDTPQLRSKLRAAKTLSELNNTVYGKIVFVLNIQTETQYGRLNPTLVKNNLFKDVNFPISSKQISQEFLRKVRDNTSRSLWSTEPHHGQGVKEFRNYPISATADSFSYFTENIKESILVPYVLSAFLNGELTPIDMFSSRLTEFFSKLQKEKGTADLVWHFVKDDLGNNKYKSDLEQALTTTPEIAAASVRLYLSTYLGRGYHDQRSVVGSLKNEIEYLTLLLPSSSDLVTESIQLAQERIKQIEALTPFEFIDRYMQSRKDFASLYILPYHRIEKLRLSAHATDKDFKRFIEELGSTSRNP